MEVVTVNTGEHGRAYRIADLWIRWQRDRLHGYDRVPRSLQPRGGFTMIPGATGLRALDTLVPMVPLHAFKPQVALGTLSSRVKRTLPPKVHLSTLPVRTWSGRPPLDPAMRCGIGALMGDVMRPMEMTRIFDSKRYVLFPLWGAVRERPMVALSHPL